MERNWLERSWSERRAFASLASALLHVRRELLGQPVDRLVHASRQTVGQVGGPYVAAAEASGGTEPAGRKDGSIPKPGADTVTRMACSGIFGEFN